MKLLLLAKDILLKVIFDDVPFSIAVKNAYKYKNVEIAQRNAISAIVGCSLRHYRIFSYRINETFGETNNDVFVDLLINLSNSLFVKKFDSSECLALAKNDMDEEASNKLDDFLLRFNNGEKLIPEDYPILSNDFLSYRYNTPIWIVKMWKKHYGIKNTVSILKSISKNPMFTYGINLNLFDKTQLESKCGGDINFIKDDIFTFINKDSISRNKLINDNLIYLYPYAVKELLDSLDIDPFRGIAVYSEYSNPILLNLVSRNSSFLKLDFLAGSSQSFFDSKKIKNMNSLNNVSIYETNSKGIITCISNKVHLFIVAPNSSKFSLLQSSPDYFLRFKQNDLDSLIENQNEALNQAKDQVEDGGYIAYIVNTLSLKETRGVIENFLKNNNDFTLLKERQFFPHEEEACIYYYAILKRN